MKRLLPWVFPAVIFVFVILAGPSGDANWANQPVDWRGRGSPRIVGLPSSELAPGVVAAVTSLAEPPTSLVASWDVTTDVRSPGRARQQR